MLNYETLDADGTVDELADKFLDSVSAGALLAKAGTRLTHFPPFGQPSIRGWWHQVCRDFGQVQDDNDLAKLLEAAADAYPGNVRFSAYRRSTSEPDNRNNRGGNIKISLPETMSVDDIIKLMQHARATALATNADVVLNIGREGSSNFSLTITGDHSDEQIEQIRSAIASSLTAARYNATVERQGHNFRDYFSDLTVEGPDSQRFAFDGIPASTTVSDVARGLIHQYADQGTWPSRKGQKTAAVVDKVGDDGTSERLDPRTTLHDAGVRPGDTLRVSPERTAGAISPLLRDAALSRVRKEVLAFAEAHPGFEVQANSLVAPTEYVFRFGATGFGPPTGAGLPPLVHVHEVLVELPADFPVKAPDAWWQTEIFHPNIDPRNGWVCLGELQDHYQPAMDFGRLCQMLMDLAGYRNYAVNEGFNPDAAKWSVSLEGQLAIESIGGISMISRHILADASETTFRVRKL